LRRWLEVLDQPKLIRATSALILDGIHTLANKVQTQPARLDFVEAAAAQLCGVDGRTPVAEQNFEAVAALGSARPDTGATHFDGLIGPSVIAMAHDIGESFIDRTCNGTAIRRRKAEDLGKAFERATHDAEQLGIAVQFELQ
jgi:hypothetical protein